MEQTGTTPTVLDDIMSQEPPPNTSTLRQRNIRIKEHTKSESDLKTVARAEHTCLEVKPRLEIEVGDQGVQAKDKVQKVEQFVSLKERKEQLLERARR